MAPPMDHRLLRPRASKPVARTLYFNAATNGDWATLANWWSDAGHTLAATRLPGPLDTVIVSASLTNNTGSPATVAALNVAAGSMAIAITVLGTATYSGQAAHAGTITGHATFNDQTGNLGAIIGDATFNDDTTNGPTGNISGTATFNDFSCNDFGTAGVFVPDPPPEC